MFQLVVHHCCHLLASIKLDASLFVSSLVFTTYVIVKKILFALLEQ